jgi:integrase
VAREWLDGRKSHVKPAQHIKTLARLKNDVFPWIGKRPISELTAPEILAVLRRVDRRGARYTAHKVRSEISRIFRFAIATGLAGNDPAQSLIGSIPPHQPAIERLSRREAALVCVVSPTSSNSSKSALHLTLD